MPPGAPLSDPLHREGGTDAPWCSPLGLPSPDHRDAGTDAPCAPLGTLLHRDHRDAGTDAPGSRPLGSAPPMIRRGGYRPCAGRDAPHTVAPAKRRDRRRRFTLS